MKIATIPVLLVTYNRLEYSKQALASILHNPGLPVEVTIWDNNSTDGTIDWLIGLKKDPRIVDIYMRNRNFGLAPAMNYFFIKYHDRSYVAKVDNDTVLPDNWLADLMEVYGEGLRYAGHVDSPLNKLGAVSGTCVRPPGLSAADWYGSMRSYSFFRHKLYFNPACLGTGVLINMDLIRQRGLLFENFPRSPDAGPKDPCLISGWGAYIQEASAYEHWKFAMYSKVPVKLLNLKEDQVLSNDYPEYDAEIKKVRDEGNAWWESVGGLDGVRKYVHEHGGLEPILGYQRIKYHFGDFVAPDYAAEAEYVDEVRAKTKLLTGASNLKERSTEKFWTERVAQHGERASSFLTTPQTRINEFTDQHIQILKKYAGGADVLDVGCGWGRLAHPLSRLAKSYIGVDFMPALVAKAKESLPDLDFRTADARHLPFEQQFDIVVASACLSSFAAIFDEVLAELKRVLRPNGFILFLEEDFARIDWKMENV